MDTAVTAVAAALKDAHRRGVTADASRPDAAALQTLAQAGAVHWALGRELDWWATPVPRVWKAGAPDAASPVTCAPLPDNGIWDSPADARDWPMGMRGVEAEIALRLGQAVSAEQAARLTPDAVHALVDAMAVSIELVDSRWRQAMDAPDLLRLADLQSHGALVLGAWQSYRRLDWQAQACEVRCGDAAVVRRQGSHSLSDPVAVLLPWLQQATAQCGEIPAGTVVTTGTWVGLLHARPGDLVQVAFAGIGQASVQL